MTVALHYEEMGKFPERSLLSINIIGEECYTPICNNYPNL